MYFRKQSLERSWRAPKTSTTLNASGNVSVPFGRSFITIEGRGTPGNDANPGNAGNVSGSYYLAGNVSGYNNDPVYGVVAQQGNISGYNNELVGYNPPQPGNPTGKYFNNAVGYYFTGATANFKGNVAGEAFQSFPAQNDCSVFIADNFPGASTNWPVYAPSTAPPGSYFAMFIPFTIVGPGIGFEAYGLSCEPVTNPGSSGNPIYVSNPNYNVFYNYEIVSYTSNPNYNPNYFQYNYNPPNNPIPGNSGPSTNVLGVTFPGGPGQDGGTYGSPAPSKPPAPLVSATRIDNTTPHGITNTWPTSVNVSVPSGGYITINFD